MMGEGASAQAIPGQEHARRRPPISILVVSVLFLAVGCLDVYRGVAPAFGGAGLAGFGRDELLVGLIGVAALVGGGFLLAGRSWARWLLAAWMALHVLLSLDSARLFLAHAVIFGLLAFLLFRPGVAGWFQGGAEP